MRHSFIRPSSIWLLAKSKNSGKLIRVSKKPKPELPALTNHKGQRQSGEPIKTPFNNMWLTRSAGKCVRASHDWSVLVLLLIGWKSGANFSNQSWCVVIGGHDCQFWFYSWLDEKVARIFQISRDAWWYKTSCFSAAIVKQTVFINIGNVQLRSTFD